MARRGPGGWPRINNREGGRYLSMPPTSGFQLAEMEKQDGARGTGSNQHRKVASSRSDATKRPSLKQLGITRNQSSAWQQLRELDRRARFLAVVQRGLERAEREERDRLARLRPRRRRTVAEVRRELGKAVFRPRGTPVPEPADP